VARRITGAHEATKVELIVPTRDGDREITLPKLGYLDPGIVKEVDEYLTEETKRVAKARADKQRKREPIPASDPTLRFPGELEAMDQLLQRIDPDTAGFISGLTFRERDDFWQAWQDESKVKPEKSSASSDSSSETE